MAELRFAEDLLDTLQERTPQYHGSAYLFLLAALDGVVRGLDEPRHITGPELAGGVRNLALRRFGPMARTVLEHWGVSSTEDIGEMVFTLVDCGLLVTAAEDRIEDFVGVFDFEEAFERDYPWAADAVDVEAPFSMKG